LRMNSRVGQPCRTCQTMCGEKSAAATHPESQGQGVASQRR